MEVCEQRKQSRPPARPDPGTGGNGLKPAPERGTVLFEDPTVRVVRRHDGTECGDAPWVAVERRRGRRTGTTTWETIPVLQPGQDGLNAVVYALGRAVADLTERLAEPVETRKPAPEFEQEGTASP